MEIGNLSDLTGSLRNSSADFIAGVEQQDTAVFIAVTVVGLLVCFFGLKLVKLLAALVGAFVGAAIGVSVSIGVGLTGPVFAVVVAVCALALAALAFGLYKFGVFLQVFCSFSCICAGFLKPDSLVPLLICIGAGVIFAVLAVIYMEPMVIIATGLSGGLSAGTCAVSLLSLQAYGWIGYAAGVVLGVAGIFVQFMMHSRRIGKKERVHAEKFKEEVSRESEVEKARMILEDEDNEDEDE